MTIPSLEKPQHSPDQPPPLRHGERLSQPEFHRRYEAMPPGVRAELVGGIVYIMSSPVRKVHSKPHSEASNWLMQFKAASPAVEMLDNTSVILGLTGEPQPDLSLRILDEYGGSSRETEDGYIEGSPELVVEIAASSSRYDLEKKKRDYEVAGVKEYVVVLSENQKVIWFVLENGRYEELQPGEDGILRSRCFPGLWLDAAALLRAETAAVNAVVAQGLATTEHREWVEHMKPGL